MKNRVKSLWLDDLAGRSPCALLVMRARFLAD